MTKRGRCTITTALLTRRHGVFQEKICRRTPQQMLHPQRRQWMRRRRELTLSVKWRPRVLTTTFKLLLLSNNNLHHPSSCNARNLFGSLCVGSSKHAMTRLSPMRFSVPSSLAAVRGPVVVAVGVAAPRATLVTMGRKRGHLCRRT